MPEVVLPELRPYAMSDDMSQIADQIGFTATGLDVFSDARPQLLDSDDFLEACVDPAEVASSEDWESIGCFDDYVYAHGQIAIFQPTDERLEAQTVVTTAHEFLHAAYARLTDDDRQALNALLAARWAEVPSDDVIREKLASSVGSWKGNRATEQFAYLGTEIAEPFDPELERYYSRYFLDRGAVVEFHLADQSLWDGLINEVDTIYDALVIQDDLNAAEDTRLEAERSQLDADQAAYDAQASEAGEGTDSRLSERRATLDQRDAQLAVEQAKLDAAQEEADQAWADLERRYDELDALDAASVPARE